MSTADPDTLVRYRVTGMDCSSCAAKIETTARAIVGVQEARVSIASQEMTLRLDDRATLPQLERKVTGLGYRLALIDAEDDDKIPDLSHVTSAYKRALWVVVLLNAEWRDRTGWRLLGRLSYIHYGVISNIRICQGACCVG